MKHARTRAQTGEDQTPSTTGPKNGACRSRQTSFSRNGSAELFKTILDEENLRFDREGRPRTAYSLRHTYICLRLMEGADIYQIAKNCRTSVEMIEK